MLVRGKESERWYFMNICRCLIGQAGPCIFKMSASDALSICFLCPVFCFKDTKLGNLVGIKEMETFSFSVFILRCNRMLSTTPWGLHCEVACFKCEEWKPRTMYNFDLASCAKGMYNRYAIDRYVFKKFLLTL